MLRYLAYILLPLLLASVVPGAYAQTALTGTVKDEKRKPISSANIVLRAKADAPILTFSITNANGEFSLKVPANMDSVFITITHLSFAAQQFYTKASNSLFDIVLIPQEYELPELVVKNEPFIRRGDTLTFDVSQYRQDSDDNIEEVLRNIPGITIEDNGRILYDGLDISKFYVEGLDMLEGRYRIVTRNLSIDAIRDIEVIEHHQAIRALDSLVRPDNAAINLRLKSGIAFTGSIRGGVGLSPALYLGRGDVFGFTKKQQFNLLAATNNIGENQRANFQNLYVSIQQLEPELVFINKVLPPFLMKENFYLNNQELTGGFNFLKKLSKNTELKWQGFARKDKILNIGRRTLRYLDGENEVVFHEVLAAKEAPMDINNRLIVELNAKKVFFRADINTAFETTNFFANNQINGVLFPESLEKRLFNSKAELTTIIRHKNKAYKINTDIQYEITDHDLELTPADIFTPTFEVTRFQTATQVTRQKKFQADSYSNLFFQTHNISGQLNVGLRYKHTLLDSDIFTRSDTTEKSSLGSAFQNENTIRELAPYINQTYELKKKKTTWTLSIPLSLSLFNIDDQINQKTTTPSPLVLRPKLRYNLRLANSTNLEASYTYEQAYDPFATLFYEGYIIRSNRNLGTSIFDLNQYAQQLFYVRVSGKNIAKRSHYALNAILSETTYDFINNNTFSPIGLASDLIAVKNKLSRLRLQGELSRQLGNDINLDVRTQYSLSSRPTLLNGRKLDIQNHFFTLQPAIYYTFAQSVLSLKSRIQVLSNSISKGPTYQFDPSLVYFISHPSIGSFRFSYHQYLTTTASLQIWNEMLNLEYKHQLKKQKIDIVLQLNNVTNNEDYLNFTQNTFSEFLSYYRLRPRQITASFIKKF